MTEENQNSEDFIKNIIQESGIMEPQKDEKRIKNIILQARRNAVFRDYVLLIFVRFWMVLAELTCIVFARSSKPRDIDI